MTGSLAEAEGLQLPAETRLRDLGEQRLKGLTELVQVFGLVHTARGESAPLTEGLQVAHENERIRIMLVDDHEVVRRGLRGFLELQPDIEVVGEAADGAEGVAPAPALRPDVVLMDLLMPRMDGLTAIAAIKHAQPEIEIVAVTSFIEEEKVTAALEAGRQWLPAQGCRRRGSRRRRPLPPMPARCTSMPAVARLLAQRMRTRKPSRAGRAAHPAREGGARPAGQGASNKEIAYEPCPSPSAPPGPHVSNILGKLGLLAARRPRYRPWSTSWPDPVDVPPWRTNRRVLRHGRRRLRMAVGRSGAEPRSLRRDPSGPARRRPRSTAARIIAMGLPKTRNTSTVSRPIRPTSTPWRSRPTEKDGPDRPGDDGRRRVADQAKRAGTS